MNNLKFRAWDKKHKEMFEVVKIEFNPNIFYMAKEPAWIVIRAKNEIELMQSTGLFDKYGVEIYEGDIVETISEFEPERAIIKFDGLEFYLEYFDKKFENESLKDIMIDLKIIGNIYENKELNYGH